MHEQVAGFKLHETRRGAEHWLALTNGSERVAHLGVIRADKYPAYIIDVLVAEQYRGRGIAGELLTYARSIMPEGVNHSADLTEEGMRWALKDPEFDPRGYARTHHTSDERYAWQENPLFAADWQRAVTGDQQLDAAIEQFGRSYFEDHGSDAALAGTGVESRPVFELAQLDVAAGRCMDVSEAFAEAARAAGADARMIDTEESASVRELYDEYDSSDSVPFHMVVEVRTRSGHYLIDWTSSQFDGLPEADFPLVHQRDGNSWQRVRPRVRPELAAHDYKPEFSEPGESPSIGF